MVRQSPEVFRLDYDTYENRRSDKGQGERGTSDVGSEVGVGLCPGRRKPNAHFGA